MGGYSHGVTREREVPTLTGIDRAFASVDRDLMNPDAIPQALSSSVLDHAPIHLSMSAAFRPKRRFKFEASWLKLEGFEEALVVQPDIVEPFRRLDALFRNAAEFFQS
jgi:hypothetical protein